MNFKELVKTKTFRAGVLTIIGAIIAAATGQMTWGEAVPTITTAITGIFVRDGIIAASKPPEG